MDISTVRNTCHAKLDQHVNSAIQEFNRKTYKKINGPVTKRPNNKNLTGNFIKAKNSSSKKNQHIYNRKLIYSYSPLNK